VSRKRQGKTEELTTDNPAGTSAELAPVIAAIAGLAAAWIAAGSIGLLAHSLRRALTLTALSVAIFAQQPLPWRKGKYLIAMLVTIVLAILMNASSLPVVNVMGVSLILVSLTYTSSGQAKGMLRISSIAVVIFGLYRLACTSIPLIWSTTDLLGRIIGNLGGILSHQSLHVGATFAGLDFLVLMSVLWALWLARSPKPRQIRATYSLLAIIGGHICYLIALSYSPNLLAVVAKPAEQADWSWAGLLHKAVPWNLPVLACMIYLLTSLLINLEAWIIVL